MEGNTFMENVGIALLMTLFAGLATGIGSLLAFFTKTTNTKFLSFVLGLSAGVMVYVSFTEVLGEAQESLTAELGTMEGSWLTVLAFFAGMLLIGLIDRFIPKHSNPHEVKKVEDMQTIHKNGPHHPELMRTGIFTALAIAIHNFPEGIAVFISALQDPALGIPITVAIAIHNIPEGIAVAVPVYYATGSKKKAFWISFLSGLSEPLGALVAFLFLMPFLNEIMFGMVFAMVAGIMVFISLDELIPAAKRYDETHLPIYGVMTGMGIMALSLLLLAQGGM
jgi:ZIP family zinc transporter